MTKKGAFVGEVKANSLTRRHSRENVRAAGEGTDNSKTLFCHKEKQRRLVVGEGEGRVKRGRFLFFSLFFKVGWF